MYILSELQHKDSNNFQVMCCFLSFLALRRVGSNKIGDHFVWPSALGESIVVF